MKIFGNSKNKQTDLRTAVKFVGLWVRGPLVKRHQVLSSRLSFLLVTAAGKWLTYFITSKVSVISLCATLVVFVSIRANN